MEATPIHARPMHKTWVPFELSLLRPGKQAVPRMKVIVTSHLQSIVNWQSSWQRTAFFDQIPVLYEPPMWVPPSSLFFWEEVTDLAGPLKEKSVPSLSSLQIASEALFNADLPLQLRLWGGKGYSGVWGRESLRGAGCRVRMKIEGQTGTNAFQKKSFQIHFLLSSNIQEKSVLCGAKRRRFTQEKTPRTRSPLPTSIIIFNLRRRDDELRLPCCPCFTSMRLVCPPSSNMKKCLWRECGCRGYCLPCAGMVSKATCPLDSSTRLLECDDGGSARATHALHSNAITLLTHTNRAHPSLHTPQHQHGALRDRAPGAGGAQ